jgi:hypothetical protein
MQKRRFFRLDCIKESKNKNIDSILKKKLKSYLSKIRLPLQGWVILQLAFSYVTDCV